MCMSPHEMSSERIEEDIEYLRRHAATDPRRADFWEARIEGLEKILKERAEAGTY